MHKSIKMMLLSLPLLVALAACSGSKPAETANATDDTMKGAGNTVAEADQRANSMMQDGAKTDDSNSSKEAKDDASSSVRSGQLNSDIRAREQRTNSTDKVSDGDLESKVRSKLEANLQKRTLTVNAKAGVVTIRGKVADQAEIDKATRLAYEINGVKDVRSELTIGAT